MNAQFSPGQRVAWSSWLPRRFFVGTVVFVRKNTVQVRMMRRDGRTKMRYVKIKRLRG
jgi:hypothetical protein